jgi:hypothetical protein
MGSSAPPGEEAEDGWQGVGKGGREGREVRVEKGWR